MKMIIGGQFRSASDHARKDDINPATGEIIDTVPLATPEDVQEALVNSRRGFLEWSSIPLYQRLQVIYRCADLIEQNRDELSKLMCTESGKVIGMCRAEVDEAVAIFRLYAEKARNLAGETLPLATEPCIENDLLFTLRQPLGVVVCIVPFNYPVELFAHKVAPALVTGNAVIVKPASDTPLQDIYTTRLLLEGGVPGNAVQILTGSGAKVGVQLTRSKLVNAVSLTGSTEAGIDIMRNSAENLHHLGLELGGNDPLIILEDCDLDKAVSETIEGRLSNAGQTCCANKRFLVQNSIRNKYIEKLVFALRDITVGDPFDEANYYGPMISETAAIEVEKQIQHTLDQGAKCIAGGKRFNRTFIEPTVLVDVTPGMDIASDMEVFGPVIPIIGFDTLDEALEIANNIPFGLQSGVMTSNMKTAFKVAKALQCGGCVINGSGNYRSIHQAFGGWKMSGIGREGVMHTLEEMTQVKTIALKGIFA